ncbi:MAG: pyruvate/2-oxoglutarate dehydrogenase complex dihydrolipoamide acyltransferase (E2) component [Shewanella sp.]|jgi:pyruvate/2-oxoglutarate dehydrogenase complex dihydrolipoamide acyltransferase (E2) component
MNDNVIPLKGLRGMIADNMMKSIQQSAQLTFLADADVSGLMTLRARLKADAMLVGIEDILLLCLKRALDKHPGLNGVIRDQAVHLSSALNVSVATPIPGGLAAPTLFNIEALGLADISAKRRDMIKRAHSNKLAPKEMSGGTFTISNLGLTKVRYFTPILNGGQLAIMGLGAIEQRPVCTDNNAIVVKPILGISLTCDHQGVDGQPAGDFLTDFIKEVETIESQFEL